MRYCFKHILICFCRNNFHRKCFFHLAVISKIINIEIRSFVDSVLNYFHSLINYFIIRSAVIICFEELLNRKIHSKVAVIRCNGYCFIAFVKFLYRIRCNLCIDSGIFKSFLDVFHKFFFEIFKIHVFYSFRKIICLASDRHPPPVTWQ